VGKPKTTVARDGFDPRVPLALERVLVERDYFVLSSMLKDDPKRLCQGLEKLEKTIADNGATDSLDDLCAAHCDRRVLLWLLHPFSKARVFKDALWSEQPGPRTVEAFFGLTSKDLDSLIKDMNAVAGQLDIVNGKVEFSSLLMMNKQLYPVWRLPHTLRTGVTVLQCASTHFARNTHIYHNIAKARLTSYVIAKVESSYALPRRKIRREFHDGEIATLISAVLDDEKCRYDSTAHRMWRQMHYQRLSMLDPYVDEKLPRLISNSPLKPSIASRPRRRPS
jgi:hypothetical protein